MNLHSIINLNDVGGIPTGFTKNGSDGFSGSTVTPPRHRSARPEPSEPPVEPLTINERVHIPPRDLKRGAHRPTKRRKVVRTEKVVAGSAPKSTATANVGDKRRRRHRRSGDPHLAVSARSSETTTRAGTASRSSFSPPSTTSETAREVLRLARETAQSDMESLGRRPFIMDVILDSQPPVTRYGEDALMEAIESRRKQKVHPEIGRTFRSQQDLDEYWTEQASLWRETSPRNWAENPPKQFYRISAERSTASWDSAPDMH